MCMQSHKRRAVELRSPHPASFLGLQEDSTCSKGSLVYILPGFYLYPTYWRQLWENRGKVTAHNRSGRTRNHDQEGDSCADRPQARKSVAPSIDQERKDPMENDQNTLLAELPGQPES